VARATWGAKLVILFVRTDRERLEAERSRVRFSTRSLLFFISGRTVALESTQPLTEMSTRDLPLVVEATGAEG
jgi:hypothetical protein